MSNEQDQADLDLERRTTRYLIETIVDTINDDDIPKEQMSDIIALHLEELLKRGRIYDVMREHLLSVAQWNLEGEAIEDPVFREAAQTGREYEGGVYTPTLDTISGELTLIVTTARTIMKTVQTMEQEVAPAMNPVNQAEH